MRRDVFIIGHPNGHLEQFVGSFKAADDRAKQIAPNNYLVYPPEDFQAELGPLPSPDAMTHLAEKIDSHGNTRIEEIDPHSFESPTADYRKSLIRAVQYLQHTLNHLSGNALDLAMKWEWREADEQFDQGEELNIGPEDIGAVDDLNVNELVRVLVTLEQGIENLTNLNSISPDEREADLE